jgi:hypothetical protein
MRLNGRREVMAYLSIRSRTTLRKYRQLGLPMHESPTGRLYALSEDLDRWERPPRFGRVANRGHQGAQDGGTRAENAEYLKLLKRLLGPRTPGRGERV